MIQDLSQFYSDFTQKALPGFSIPSLFSNYALEQYKYCNSKEYEQVQKFWLTQYKDDVPEEIKAKRLTEIINLQSKLSHQSNLKDLNKTFRVLVDSVSKRSDKHLCGRNDQNKVIVFPRGQYKPGDYVDVLVTDCTPATLLGEIVEARS